MEIKNFDKEFVERTKRIIEHSSTSETDYEVSLLLNCLLALISLPTERTKNQSKEKAFKSAVVTKATQLNVIRTSTDDDKLFRTVKNAMSHMCIEIKNKGGKISNIVFRDKVPGAASYHTTLEFTPQQLKEFALFVAEEHLKRLSKQPRQTNKSVFAASN